MGKKPVDRSPNRASSSKPARKATNAERQFVADGRLEFFRAADTALGARLVQHRLKELASNPAFADVMLGLIEAICTEGKKSVAANRDRLAVLFPAITELFDFFPDAERMLLLARLGVSAELSDDPTELATHFKVSVEEISRAEANSLTALLSLLPRREDLTSAALVRYAPHNVVSKRSRSMPSKEQLKNSEAAQSHAHVDLTDQTLPSRSGKSTKQRDLSPDTLSQEVDHVLKWYHNRANAILGSTMLVSQQEQLLDILAHVPVEISNHLLGNLHPPKGAKGNPQNPRLYTVHEAALEKGCSRGILHRLVSKGLLGLQIAKTQLVWSHQLLALIVRSPGRPKGT